MTVYLTISIHTYIHTSFQPANKTHLIGPGPLGQGAYESHILISYSGHTFQQRRINWIHKSWESHKVDDFPSLYQNLLRLQIMINVKQKHRNNNQRKYSKPKLILTKCYRREWAKHQLTASAIQCGLWGRLLKLKTNIG